MRVANLSAVLLEKIVAVYTDHTVKFGHGQLMDLHVVVGAILFIIMICAVATNAFLRYSHVRNRVVLHSSFTIDIVALSLSNLCCAISSNFPDGIYLIYQAWVFGRSICSFFLYGINLFNPLQVHFYLAITLNRLWAVTSPIKGRLQTTSPRP